MYRKRGDTQTIPEIEKYIEERLLKKPSSEVATLETDDDQANMEIEDGTLTPTSDHQEDEEENQKTGKTFIIEQLAASKFLIAGAGY